MTENNSTKPITQSLEAAASWNTKYQTTEGFVRQITLRAENGKELLDKAGAAITFLLANGCTPYETISFRPKSNSNGHKNQNSNTSATENSNENNGESHLCPIHKIEMKRWEKDGRVWFSHKSDNGWCTGK